MRQLLQRLRLLLSHLYSFVLMDEVTFRQSWHLRFKLGHALAVILGALGFVFVTTSLLIVFTPVREWIPGYTDPEQKRKQVELLQKVTQLEDLAAKQDSFIRSLQRVSGYVPADSSALADRAARVSAQRSQQAAPAPAPATTEATPTPAAPTATATRAAYTPTAQLVLPLLWPVDNAMISGRYELGNQHFAIDLAAAQGTPVRAIADGFVILSEYTDATGQVIGIQHRGGMVSFYKHNSRLFKSVGSFVQAGEVIAAVGNSGTHTTGSHLHFELWLEGMPVDPLAYLPVRDNP